MRAAALLRSCYEIGFLKAEIWAAALWDPFSIEPQRERGAELTRALSPLRLGPRLN
jgi:hypothetical protein